MAHRGRTPTNDPVLIDTTKRRAYVLNLRRMGISYRDIATATETWAADNDVVLPKGWDCRYAYMDVKREMDKLRNGIKEDAEMIRSLELVRLDTLLRSVWGDATGRNVPPSIRNPAIDRVLRIMDQRRRLVPDLDAPIVLTEDTVIHVIGGVDLNDLK